MIIIIIYCILSIINDKTTIFAELRDNYPKYVVSMTPGVTRSDDNGVTHLHLRNFLMLENLDWVSIIPEWEMEIKKALWYNNFIK